MSELMKPLTAMRDEDGGGDDASVNDDSEERVGNTA